MNKFAFLIKTYSADILYVERLIKSFDIHNIDSIPLYIVAPEEDLFLFSKYIRSGIELFADEEICNQLAQVEYKGIRPGYLNQEIIKLAFWEKKLCENYFCIDSDGVFIRDFYLSDFMYNGIIPYTILIEDNELKVEPEYFKSYWEDRYKCLKKIRDSIGLNERHILTNHGFSILSSKVLESFKKNFLEKNGKSYLDIILEVPYEFSWYSLWLQHDKTIEIKIREPLFKTFHHRNQHIEYIFRGVGLSDLARGYIGVVINSNYSRDFGVISFGQNRMKVLAQYLSNKEVLEVVKYKAKSLTNRLINKLCLLIR